MKTEHFNKLTEAELEAIAILQEECGEVVQICGKILRHGKYSYNPFDEEKKLTNQVLLAKEVADVLVAIDIAKLHFNHLSDSTLSAYKITKKVKLKNYLHHVNKDML